MVTDLNALRFCNGRIRVLADTLARAYNLSKAIINEGTAQGLITGATPTIPNTSEQISDGAVIDGRPQIVGSDIYNVVTAAQTLISYMEATSNSNLNKVLKVSVNPQ